MMTQIETANVTKRYDGSLALDQVSVKASSQRITSIVGVNGAGKTTLLKIIAGLQTPSEGKVLIEAKEVSPTELRTHCTMVFQRSVMLGGSVYDNVAYGLRLNQTVKRDIPAKVESVLAIVNLDGFEKRKARRLSSGEQQRVAIARALALERDALLVDEPTTNLDPANAGIIEQAIKESARSRVVLLSTHNMSQARRLSDQVIHLYRGRIIEEGESSRFFASPRDERTKLFINGELQF
ncbi:ABC transporter ATP-binding protein [[Eubacterium] cellulosolvens]